MASGDTARISDLVAHTTFADFPRAAVDTVKMALLDTVGVGLGGTRTPEFEVASEWVRTQGPGATGATILGVNRPASTSLAAFANAVAMHALDFDDGNHPSFAHTSCVLIPTIIGLGEQRRISGADLITAYLLGFEIDARLGAVLNPSHARNGWHSTSTLGTLGAAAAGAKVLGLPADAVAMSLGVSASYASGLTRNFGTTMKPFHAGHAAHNGVMAATLASLGVESDPDILGSSLGFYEVFQGPAGLCREEMVKDLGDSWAILSLPGGYSIKPFASCGGTHNAIQAALAIRSQPSLDHRQIESIEIGTNRMSAENLIRHRPQTGTEGKYSLEYCVAAALLFGGAGPREFTDERVQSADVQRLISLSTISVPPEFEEELEHPARVTIRQRDGQQFSHDEHLALGKPQNPMSRQARVAKFRDCTDGLLSPSQQDHIIELIDTFENVESVTRLVSACAISDNA